MAALLAAVLATALLAGCADDSETPLPAGQLRVATGLDGGVYRVYGRALADILDTELRLMRTTDVQTEGSIDNLQLLDTRRADIAFSLADAALLAIEGKEPFSRPVKVAALARLYDDYLQIIVRKDSTLRRIGDLAGKTVSIGAKRSGTAVEARRILRLPTVGLRRRAPVKMRSLTLKESTAALIAGDIAAFFWSGGLPSEAIIDLRKKVDIRLLGLPEGTAKALDAELYIEAPIPRYHYGEEGAVNTVIASNLLVVRQDLPREVAYRITRALFEHRRQLEKEHPQATRLNLRSATRTYPLKLHPGARRWYREARR
jgi:TRAP transporter TAXI family solute receptor